MKKILKVLLGLLGVVLILVLAGVSYLSYMLPAIPVPDNIVVNHSPENVARGKYLANEMMGCVGCHAQRDFSKFAGPIIKSSMGEGGEYWGENVNFPGEMYAPNISPAALGDWTDAELFRAITMGVNKEGKALFPIMPYLNYGRLPKQDIYDVIAYIRTLPSSDKTYPERKLNFPLNLIVNTIPVEGISDLVPDENDLIKHGEYVTTATVCNDCHTPMDDKGNFIQSLQFAGGSEFIMPTGGTVRSANLTPDKDTGLGNWTKEAFIARFKAYGDSSYVPHSVARNEFNSIMPWDYYAQLKDRDIEAIFAYLQSLEPVSNKVIKFTSN